MSVNSGEKPRLLIVDDSRVIRVTARKILRDHFETVEAVDGLDAWEKLANDASFSLIVSDLTMPNLDGFGLMERIRHSHLPHVKDIPVIIITGANDSETTMERARAAGATDFIGKPFDSVHLLARTQAHASANASARMLSQKKIELEEKSPVDPVTGLANDLAFMERGYQLLAYAIRHQTSLSTFRIEIDNYGELFKKYGNPFAQSSVKLVATVLRENIRQEDMAARIGTARFALLIQSAGKSGSRNMAERMRSDISKRILRHEGQPIHISVSIGVAAPEIRRDTRFDSMLLVADNHLAHAVASGGNRVIYDSADIARSNRARFRQWSQPVPAAESDLELATVEVSAADSTAAREMAGNTGKDNVIPYTRSGDGIDAPVECLATDKPRPLPARFAGPAPEGRATFTVSDPAVKTETGRGKARFALPEDDLPEETIVITAPYSAHRDDDIDILLAQETGNAGEQPASADTPAMSPDDVIEVASDEDSDNDEPPRRRGLLRGLKALFGRSRGLD
jgi:two-component system cell cycle response regulator